MFKIVSFRFHEFSFELVKAFRYYFLDLVVKKCEITRIPKCTPFWLEMFKITSVRFHEFSFYFWFLGLRPRPRWGSLRRSLRLPSREGLLAFGNRSFAPSALNPPLAPPK